MSNKRKSIAAGVAFVVALIVGVWSSPILAAMQSPTVDPRQEYRLGALEEMAMCHHAIKAARHDGLSLDQNPYYRYVLNAPTASRPGIYPMPGRCKTIALEYVVPYTTMSNKEKADIDRFVSSEIGMTVPDMAIDVQFLTVVITKMEVEGDAASLWENRDKLVPSSR